MTATPAKQRLQDGERVFGTMVFEFFSPGMPRIAKVAGAEFILFDMEHTALDRQMFRGNRRQRLSGIVDVAQRRIPAHVVNPDVLDHPRIRAWFGG